MEVISDVYGGIERTCEVKFYEDFCSITVFEPSIRGTISSLKIRLTLDSSTDLLFFDQLRAEIDKVAKFLRP